MNSEHWLAKRCVDITLCQHRKFAATLLLKFFVLYYKRNIKHFTLFDIQLYQHSWKLEKLEIVWKHCIIYYVSTQFLVFQFPLVLIFKKYKTFSVLIYSYINTSGNWKNEKLCGNTTPAGRSVFTQFRVFPIFTSVDITVYQYGKNVLYFFYNIAQKTLTEEWREIFRVDIELYQHGS